MKLKKIIATVVALASFASISAVSYAASLVETANAYKFETKVFATDGSDTIEAGENITVEIYIKPVDGEDVDFGKNGDSEVNATFIMPADVVDVDEDTQFFDDIEGISAIGLSDRNEDVKVSVDTAANVCSIMFCDSFNKATGTITADEPAFTLTFFTKETAPAGTYAAELNFRGCSMVDAISGATYKSAAEDCTSGSFTIAGGEPTGTTATEVKDAGNADKKIAAYDIANDENVKRVLIFTEEQTALTSESRFIVTGEGRTQKFGGDIWDRVGSVEGEGIMKVAKVIFGLIVDASATADDFTFSVGK